MQKIDKTDTLKTILSGRKYTVDYFQREYRWGQKQIEQMQPATSASVLNKD